MNGTASTTICLILDAMWRVSLDQHAPGFEHLPQEPLSKTEVWAPYNLHTSVFSHLCIPGPILPIFGALHVTGWAHYAQYFQTFSVL